MHLGLPDETVGMSVAQGLHHILHCSTNLLRVRVTPVDYLRGEEGYMYMEYSLLFS